MAFGQNLSEIVGANRNRLLSAHESWERIPLGQLVEIKNGFAFKSAEFSKEDGVPLVRIRDVLPGTTSTFYEGEIPDGYWIEPGDLLVGMDGDFNSRVWRGPSALLNQRVCRLRLKVSEASFQFIVHALPGYLGAIHEHTSAVTVKHLSSNTLSEIPFPLPPVAEQARIAEKIDTLFAQIEAGEAALAAARRNVARYRKAVLKAAVTGALTADWRAENSDKVEDGEALRTRLLAERRAAWERDQIEKAKAKGKPLKGEAWKAKYKPPVKPERGELPDLPEGWVWASLGQLTSLLTDGTHQAPKKAEDGVPFVTISNIDPFRLDLNEVAKFVSEEEYSKHARGREVTVGDVLYTAVGSYGMAVTVAEGQRFLIQRHIALLRPTSAVENSYLTQYLNGPIAKGFADRRARGVAQKTVTLGDMSEMPIALPSFAEQAEIVARVEAALAEADRLDAQLGAQERASKALRQSVLKAAFEGRLVPQDPNDEPASKLLERVAAERANVNKKGRRRNAAL